MSLSIEELIRPRYKVIADYPESPYKIGDIEFNDTWSDNGSLAEYPAIFRKLEWFEDREPGDMPKYVKRVGGPHKSKVVLRVLNPMHNGREFGHEENTIEHRFIYPSASGYLPATLEEYNAFKSGKS